MKKDLDNLMLDSYLEIAAENLGYKSVDDRGVGPLKINFKHQMLVRTVEKSRGTGLASVEKVFRCSCLNRDAYYKTRVRISEQKRAEAKVIGLVKKERESQPRVGTVKLQKHFTEDFIRLGVKIGRDRLFDVLRA